MMHSSKRLRRFITISGASGANYKEQIDHGATTYGSPLTAHSLSAFCLLPSAFCLLAGSATHVAIIADTFTLSHTFAIADAAAKFASMGRGNFISRTAFGSNARNCADGIRRHVVCN
jgi:hypothetical protein